MNRLHGTVATSWISSGGMRLAALLALAVLVPACGGGGRSAAIIIPLSLQFQQGTFTVAETGGTATITVTRAGTATGAVSVNFATSNGTATQPGDYTTNTGTLSWADGDAANKTFTVAIGNDGTVEGDETIALTLSLPTGGAILGSQSTAVLTITDDDAPAAGVVQFSAATYSVNEDATTATITVTRTGGSTGAASVNFSDAGGGSATSGGTDYALTGATLNWAAGDATPKTFTVTIANDALLEANETINLSLTGAVGAAVGTTSTAVLTILDNDSPASLQFSTATYSVSESGVTATVTVTRTGGVGNAVGVTFATSDGTATIAGPDYNAATGTLSWGGGDSASKSFTVTILADTVVEGDETINLALSAPTGGAVLGAQNTALLSILDDDCTLQFTAATFSVLENVGTATITVSRLGSTLGAVSVDFSNPAGGTAAGGGTDYTFTAGTLNWAVGDSADKTISIPVGNDPSAEGNETLNLALSNVTGVGAAAGSQTTAVVTLVDNDVVFQFSAATYSVGENGATATITVNRVGASSGAASVDWTTPAGGTAAVASDYGAVPGTLNWPDGDMTSKTFAVTIVNDSVAEADETLNLALANPATLQAGGNAALGTPNAAVLTILNDDVNLQLTSATYGGAENGGAITITVTRTGLLTGACSVAWSLVNGTTVNGDYSATPGTLTWAAGDGADKTFTITPVNDAAVEGSETLTINLSGESGATLGTPNSAVLTITDDDVPSATIDDVTVAEGAAGTTSFTFTITLSAAPVAAGSVIVNTANGATNPATAGSDYTAVVGQVVTFGIGVTSQQVTVTVNGDTTDELNETFFVNLTSPVNLNIADAQGLGTITNDDNPTITVGAASIAEGTGAGTTTLDFPLTLSHASLQDVVVTFSTANGTAAAPADFTAVAGGTATITAGNTTGQISVTIVRDAIDEAAETFTVTMTPDANATVSGGPSATGTITNDDDPTITVGGASIPEGTGAGTTTLNFPLTLSHASLQDVVVTFSTADGAPLNGAVAPADYTAVAGGTVTITAGNTTGQISITIARDADDEASETFTVTITPDANAAVTGSPTATGTILDDEGPTVSIGNVSQAEGNAGPANFVFTVTLSAPSPQDVSVNFATSNGTATQPGDYAAQSATLTIPAGSPSGTITIVVNGDSASEPDETFIVTLSNPVDCSITGGTGTGTIQTDDIPGISITSAVGLNEGNAATTAFVFTVSLTNAPSALTGAVSVNFQTNNGSASAPGDFTAVSNTLNWAIGDGASQTITVQVNGDTTLETNETFTVVLSGATNANILQGTGTGTITNDDGPEISVVNSTTRVEGSVPNSVTHPFTVSLSGPPTSTVTVNYTTTDGTATAADGDYTTTAGTLTFLVGGPTVQVINVPIGSDNKHEPNETLTMDISGAVGGTIAVPSALLTIFDDDPVPSISISNVTQGEGNAGTTAFSFTVTLSNATYQTVTVTANTANGSATLADSDYQQVLNQTVTFSPFDTSETVTVLVNGDTNPESSETFTVVLTSPSNATISDGSGLGTIVNDEGPNIVTTIPVNSATNQMLDTNMVITFSEAMDKPATEAAISIARSPVSSTLPTGRFVWSAGDTVLTIVFDTVAPSGTLADVHADDLLTEATTYTVTVGAAAEGAVSGLTLGTPQPIQFTTVPDATPAQVVSITPDPASLIPSGTTVFTVTFSEPMNQTQGMGQIRGGSVDAEDSIGSTGTGMTVAWISATQFQITLTSALPDNTGFRMDLNSFNDVAGNFTELDDLPLVTANAGADAVRPTVNGSTPANGDTNVNRDNGIIIAFSEPIRVGLTGKITVSGTATTGVDFNMRHEVDDISVLQIQPKKAWGTGTVTVTIDCAAGTGAADPKGNILMPNSGNNYVISFTTTAGTASAMVVDSSGSSIKSANVDMNTSNITGFYRFFYNATTTRAYVNAQTLTPRDVRIVDPATTLPVKGHLLEVGEQGDLRIYRSTGKISGLSPSTTYNLTLNATLQNSRGTAFASVTHTLTTVSGGGNAAPQFSGIPETSIDSLAGTANNLQIFAEVQNPSPAGGETVSVTATAPGTFTNTGISSAGQEHFNYQFDNTPTGITGTGDILFTLTATDAPGGHSLAVTAKGYIFPASETNATLTGPPASTTSTPTYTWSWPGAVPASIQGIFVHVEATGGGTTVFETFVPRAATSFTQPADRPLPPGTYNLYIGAVHFEDNIIKGDISVGIMGPRAFTVP